jgi:hypothetical protein
MSKPTRILKVSPVKTKTGRGYLWDCDNGESYLTRDMADIIGKSPESLVAAFYRHGINNDKLFRPSASYRKRNRKSNLTHIRTEMILTCNVGDFVLTGGNPMQVSEVVMTGREDSVNRRGNLNEGERSMITVCRIMRNGQILKRSPIYIGDNWVHLN